MVAALVAAAGSEWLLVTEYQAQANPSKLLTLREEAVRLYRTAITTGPPPRVLTALVYLTGTCPACVIAWTLPTQVGTRHEALVWNVAHDEATAALATVRVAPTQWGLLYWVPLMRGAEAPEVVAERGRLLTELVPSTEHRGNLRGIALVFAELAKRLPVWERGLGEMTMTESTLVNRWMSQAESRAELRMMRQNLIYLLELRFPTARIEAIAKMIETQDDLNLLQRWFAIIAQCKCVDELIQSLR